LCPRKCRINRQEGQIGVCGIGAEPVLSAAEIHTGEEPPLITGAGSGTIFMAGCIADCCFCQNYQISQQKMGRVISIDELAGEFLSLQAKGCSNINWVTPTPHLPFLLHALARAIDRGLTLPLVYNCNGYMDLDILRGLDGIVDIYLPDMKYGESIWAEQFSKLPDYPEINSMVIKEMYRQVGILKLDITGRAVSGLLVRHLVLPEGTAGSEKVIRTIAEIDPEIGFSLMAQYRPCYKAVNHDILGRSVHVEEFDNVCELVELYGLTNLFIQSSKDLKKRDYYFPDFNRARGEIFS